MAKQYTIVPGDTLTKIAAVEGFPSWRDIYYHPDNAAFRSKRPNPDRIFPGDLLIIPNKAGDPAEVQTSTEFNLYLMENFDGSHLPRAVITFRKVTGTKTSSYIFQPTQFAQVLDRKLVRSGREPSFTQGEFETPEPMTTASFAGPVSLVQVFRTPEATICEFFLTATGATGPHSVHTNIVTDPSVTDDPVAHGIMIPAGPSMPIHTLARPSVQRAFSAPNIRSSLRRFQQARA